MSGVDSPTIPNLILKSTNSETPAIVDNATQDIEDDDVKRANDNQQQPKDNRGSWWQPAVFSP